MSKNIVRNQKIHQNIEKYRNPEGLEFSGFTGEILYFLRFFLFLPDLHTVEVAGSNPASPTISFSTTCMISGASKRASQPKTVPDFGPGNRENRKFDQNKQ